MSYTKDLVGDITEKGFANYDTVKLQEICTKIDANLTSLESTLSNIALEATADIVGGMLTGNTETGLTLSYQDEDNTIDAAVTYGTGVTATATSSTSVDGEANSAARGDHQHGIGTHSHADSTHGGALALTAITGSVAWTTWEPTVVFGTATPVQTVVARYCRVSNLIYFALDITSADGAGGTFTSATLPVTPADVDAYIPCNAVQKVDTTYSAPIIEIDAADGTGGNRIITARTITEWTDDVACRLSISGFYEVAAA